MDGLRETTTLMILMGGSIVVVGAASLTSPSQRAGTVVAGVFLWVMGGTLMILAIRRYSGS